MKKKAICLFTGVLVFGVATFSFTATPGSDEDPIVTKSYVDSAIASLKEELNAGNTSDSEESVESVGFVVKDFKKGEIITCNANTQIVLRVGSAKVTSPHESGLSDLTGACDIVAGKDIHANHLLLVPRTDGRGLEFTENSTILISGEYTKE